MNSRDLLEVSHAQNLELFQRHLLHIGEEMGFGLFAAVLACDQAEGPRSVVMINNAPTGFEDAARRVPESLRDPVLQQLNLSSLPFLYDQNTYVCSGSGDLWEEQAPFGYKTGISVALHLPQGKHFMLGFDRDAALPTSDKMRMRLLADLQLLAVHAQSTATRLLSAKLSTDPSHRLSKRQTEVLMWARAGKTNWEIGKILGISESTVKFFISSILEKLGVQTRHAAVRKAMDLGIFDAIAR